MMTLIERLRSGSTAPTDYPDIVRVIPASDVMLEAAGRIAELEAALRTAIDAVNGVGSVTVGDIHAAAAVLNKK